MPASRLITRLVLPLAVALSLASCGLRLPAGPSPAAVHTPVSASTPAPAAGEQDSLVLVWLLADTLHTGMVFSYDWLIESGFIPPENFGHPRYVSMSWGNRDAYVEKRWLSPWKVCRALFTPSPSVMEIIPFDWDVTEVVPHQRIYRKLVDRSHGPRLAAFLNHCSRPGADGMPIVIGPSSWGDGLLLESRHAYFFPRICNIWTVQAIEACGCRLNPWFGISANGLIRQAVRPPNDFEKIWNGPEKEPDSDSQP